MRLVYGIGCAVSGDVLYALGGNQGTRGLRLNLSSHAGWEQFELTERIGMHPSVAAAEEGLYVLGGDGDPAGSVLRFLDTRTLLLQTRRPVASEAGFLARTSLVRSDLIPSEYISFGGRQRRTTWPALREYDSVRGRWRQEEVHFHARHPIAAVNNGSLYVIAGLDTVHIYSIRSKAWAASRTTGPAPRARGLTTTHHADRVFAVHEGTLFVLDLPTLAWSQHTIPGLEGRTHGCLAFHGGKLVHAFGLSETPSNTTQWIDLGSFRLDEANPIPALIGAGLLVCLGVALAILCVLRRLRARLAPPRMIVQPLWSDSLSLAASADYTHYPEVDDAPASIFMRRRTYSLSIATKLYSDYSSLPASPTKLIHA